VQTLRDMAAKGHTSEQISRVLKRSREAVRNKARLIGVSFSLQHEWTDEEIATVREMWAAGESAAKIAAVIGRSRNAVLGYIHRNKIPGRVTKARAKSAPRRVPQGPRWGQKQRPASLADRNAGAIQVRRYPSHAADTGAGDASPAGYKPAPVLFAPANPQPWNEADGCQYPLDARAYVDPGQHRFMLCCNEPRDTGSRYCPFHVVHQSMRPAA
jgi:GcrA cell cycle regulator